MVKKVIILLGPVEERRCTDQFWCYLIILFAFAIWYSISKAPMASEEKAKILTTPMDSQGRSCGLDEEVKDYPFLYYAKFLNNEEVSYCVKSCPEFDYNTLSGKDGDMNYEQFEDWRDSQKKEEVDKSSKIFS